MVIGNLEAWFLVIRLKVIKLVFGREVVDGVHRKAEG
jgi:hypothetical protein